MQSFNTYLSASSRIMILCLPGGRLTFVCENILILFLTTSIPLENKRKAIKKPKTYWKNKSELKSHGILQPQLPVIWCIQLQNTLLIMSTQKLTITSLVDVIQVQKGNRNQPTAIISSWTKKWIEKSTKLKILIPHSH